MAGKKLTETFELTEESFKSFAEGGSDAAVAIIYSISKYHEKYRMTKWALEEIERRGMTKGDIAYFDDQFSLFYDQMLNQDNL